MQIGAIRMEYCNRCQEPTVQRLDRYAKEPATNIWRCISGGHYVDFRLELRELKIIVDGRTTSDPRRAKFLIEPHA